MFAVVFFVLKSLLGIARQCMESCKIAILFIKPRSQVRILLYRTCRAIDLYLHCKSINIRELNRLLPLKVPGGSDVILWILNNDCKVFSDFLL